MVIPNKLKAILPVALMAFFMSGCIAWTPVKIVGERICSSETTEAQRAVLKEQWDAEMGHIMYAPKCVLPAKEAVTITGDVE